MEVVNRGQRRGHFPDDLWAEISVEEPTCLGQERTGNPAPRGAPDLTRHLAVFVHQPRRHRCDVFGMTEISNPIPSSRRIPTLINQPRYTTCGCDWRKGIHVDTDVAATKCQMSRQAGLSDLRQSVQLTVTKRAVTLKWLTTVQPETRCRQNDASIPAFNHMIPDSTDHEATSEHMHSPMILKASLRTSLRANHDVDTAKRVQRSGNDTLRHAGLRHITVDRQC
ncbi:MAG: hypothetical protein U1C73_00400, partial [Dietzia sp.]|nr:hypothetical protein [Dietzia sp.]